MSPVEILLTILDFLRMVVMFNYHLLYATFRLFVPVEPKSLKGEIVLITGAGGGIGRQLALQYAKQGCKVVCLDIDEKNNEKTVKEANSVVQKSAVGYKCDITSREEVLAIAERVKKEVGCVTVLVNNAGIMPTRSLLQHTHEVVRKVMDINLMSHFWALEAFLPAMYEAKRGTIVSTSSLLGLMGMPNTVPYTASKFAVRGYMEALLSEILDLHPDADIQMLTVCPSWVDTNLVHTVKMRFPNLFRALSPKYVAEQVVLAHRRGQREITVPWFYSGIIHFLRLMPYKCNEVVRRFLDGKVECDL
ncbi:short-chain dehydrogenase/reductase family 16C member 6-like [Culicoides brevitarsis]|uniref:short-chain dehydrogenase/reductase family 16C member 6-like n=1 Tax=Culicoides brevitarsis TaxID=469753 RepID=UPI00307C154C